MKHLNTSLLLCAAALTVSMATAKPALAETPVAQESRSAIKTEQCANDTFSMHVNDWTNIEEASATFTSNVRSRLTYMLGQPGWNHVQALIARQDDRPYISREDGNGPLNARVTYRFCWELRGGI